MSSADIEPPGLTLNAREQRNRYKLAQKLLILLAGGGLFLGLLFGCLGVTLVYLGATGNTELKLFGQTLSTGSTGVACIFIAAVTVLTVVRSVLKSFHHLIELGIRRESKN
jgi:hypothetical protein